MSTRRTAGTVEVANATITVSGTVDTIITGPLGQLPAGSSIPVVFASDVNPVVYSIPATNTGGGNSVFVANFTDTPGLNGFGDGLIPGSGLLACFDDSSSTTITENNFGTLRISTRRELYTQLRDAAGNERGANVSAENALNVTPIATTAGGCTSYSFISTAAVQAAEIKSSAGQVYGLLFFNNSATVLYGRIYNQTGTPGTGDAANIKLRFMIPGSANGAGYVVPFPVGLACGTGIGIRVSGAIADNDATALTANDLIGNVLYK